MKWVGFGREKGFAHGSRRRREDYADAAVYAVAGAVAGAAAGAAAGAGDAVAAVGAEAVGAAATAGAGVAAAAVGAGVAGACAAGAGVDAAASAALEGVAAGAGAGGVNVCLPFKISSTFALIGASVALAVMPCTTLICPPSVSTLDTASIATPSKP